MPDALCEPRVVGRVWQEGSRRKVGRCIARFKKKQRSGSDLGEILATEYVNRGHWGYEAPVHRLRWKDGRDLAMRGDDIIGFNFKKQPVGRLKGESKSRAVLADATLDEARTALQEAQGGFPGRFRSSLS